MNYFRLIFVFFAIFNIVSCAQSTDESDVCPKIVKRKKWGANPPTNIDYLVTPIKNVIIHHTVTQRCASKLRCSQVLTGIQRYHMQNLKYDDIAFNFFVGDDGIYEGTGWRVEGSHSYGYNKNSTGISFIGTFSEELPTEKAIKDTKQLLECGVEKGVLDPDYNLLAARQVIATESPGLEFYGEIQEWEHWTSKIF